jgi:hypothetical protein
MEETTKNSEGRGTLREIAKEFLRLGFVVAPPAYTFWRCGAKLRVWTAIANRGHRVGARDANHRETEFAGAGGSVQRAEPHESGDAEPVCERATVRDDHDGDDAGTTNTAEREVVVLIVVVDS